MKPIIITIFFFLTTTLAQASTPTPYWDDPLNSDTSKEWSLFVITNGNNTSSYYTSSGVVYSSTTPKNPQVSFQGPMTFRECHYARARLLGEPATKEEQLVKDLAAAKAAAEQAKRDADLKVYETEWCARAPDGRVDGNASVYSSQHVWECKGGKVESSYVISTMGGGWYTGPTISRAECFK